MPARASARFTLATQQSACSALGLQLRNELVAAQQVAEAAQQRVEAAQAGTDAARADAQAARQLGARSSRTQGPDATAAAAAALADREAALAAKEAATAAAAAAATSKQAACTDKEAQLEALRLELQQQLKGAASQLSERERAVQVAEQRTQSTQVPAVHREGQHPGGGEGAERVLLQYVGDMLLLECLS